MNIKPLVNFIKNAEAAKARSFIDEVLSSYENMDYSASLIRVMLHTAAEELNNSIDYFYVDLKELECILFSIDCEYISNAIAYLCEAMHSAKVKNEKMLYEKAIEYIRLNYTNQLLSAAGISRMLGISASSFSVIFKKYSKEGFSEYINRLRTEKSTELLLNSDASVAAVAEAVGYTCPESYIRIFKKFKNVTPGVFRHL